ncbi:hypothetical protein LN650_05545 [Klebsiella pneumoniae subsp. pneumoniae]|nr:hypothetical protein [Klebsiella pneumoniae subsp. pneumoniae]
MIGHSDAMVGTAVANARCWPQLRENAYLMGQMLDADTALYDQPRPAHPGRAPASAS